MPLEGPRPEWLTFDCYGTLIQWDEGLLAAVRAILAGKGSTAVDPDVLIATYDRHEHALEQTPPHRSFREVAGKALARAMDELGVERRDGDLEILTSGIASMPPFPEVPATLAELRRMGFRLCIVSNTDDDIIAGNVAQLGGHVEQVITAQQAGAYKPSPAIFEHAHRALRVHREGVVHVCASPHLDLAAARDLGFRCVWINRGTAREPLPDYVPDAELPTLAPLPALLAAAGWQAP